MMIFSQRIVEDTEKNKSMIKTHILLTKDLHSSSEYFQLYIIVYILYNPRYLPCLQKKLH